MVEYNKYPSVMYAGFWIRLFAYLLDLIMIGSIQSILLIFLKDGVIKSAFGLIIFLSYFVLMTKLTHGQTLGKMVFGLRVVCFTEEELSWKTVVVRELFGRYLQKVLLIMYILVAFTPLKQHVVDIFTDTSVISENYFSIYKNHYNLN